jgi:hypothetical protein
MQSGGSRFMPACGTVDGVRRRCLGGALLVNAVAQAQAVPQVNSLPTEGDALERIEIGPKR